MAASKVLDSKFDDDDDICRQFDHYPSKKQEDSSKTEVTSVAGSYKQHVSKGDILDILKIVKSSLENAWNVSCGGRKRKLKKLEMLEEIERKIETFPDDVNLSMVLQNAIAPTSCVPALFGRNMNRVMEKQLHSTLHFLDETMNTEGDSARATLGSSFVRDEDEDEYDLEMMTAQSSNASSVAGNSSSMFTSTSYDADTEENGGSSSFEGLSEDDSDDVVVTTCDVESDLGPLGVSITTWSRRILNGESMRSKASIADSVAEAEKTSGSKDNASSNGGEHDNNDDHEDGQTLEEVSVSFGDNIVVRASRTRSVRFSGVKPSTDDNINRAMELLKNARLMRAKMNES